MTKERFEKLREYLGLNQEEMAKKLNYYSDNRISNYQKIISGKNNPTLVRLNKLFSIVPNLNLNWFFNGRGKMFLEDLSNIALEPEIKYETRNLLNIPELIKYVQELETRISLLEDEIHKKKEL